MSAIDPGERLARQLDFVLEIDALKRVDRRSWILGGSRRENSAEHSWHLALMALVLTEHAGGPLDRDRVMRMVLLHDLVEIDTGDTFVYDEAARRAKAEQERVAAERIFGLLPRDQASELAALWQEYEDRRTPEARFAGALDRLMPLLHNLEEGGRTWREHGVTADRVLEVNRTIEQGSPALWALARGRIERAARAGVLPTDDPVTRWRDEAFAKAWLELRGRDPGDPVSWLRRLEIDVTSTLLDLGCGDAQLLAALAPHVGRAVGIEAAPLMLDAARRRLESVSALNVEVLAADFRGVDLPAASLDAAVAIDALRDVPDVDKRETLGRLRRALKPRAVLFVEDDCLNCAPRDLASRLAELRAERAERWGDAWPVVRDELRGEDLAYAPFADDLLALIDEAGFDVEDRETLGLGRMRLRLRRRVSPARTPAPRPARPPR